MLQTTNHQITLLDPADERWLAFVADHAQSTIFHHPVWMKFLKTCYGYQSALPVLLNPAGQPMAALPLMQISSWLTGRRMVSLPFSDFCQPLIVNGDSPSELVAGLRRWRLQNRLAEIHIHWPVPISAGVYSTDAFYRHVTHLDSDSARVFQMFPKTRVRQIRKAERDGVRIQSRCDWEAVHLFYAMHLRNRRRLGTPVQPLHFFRQLWSQLISQGFGFVLLAYQDTELLAGAVFLHYNKTLTYKYGASDPAYWWLHPNNLIFWNAMYWGCEHGYRVFDWGRTDLENAGVREFKRQWGAEEHILQYSVLADHPPGPSLVSKSRRLQTTFIRHSPAYFCRLMGEVFYRHIG